MPSEDLSGLSLQQLKALAKQHKIPKCSNMNKNDLYQALIHHQKHKKQNQDESEEADDELGTLEFDALSDFQKDTLLYGDEFTFQQQKYMLCINNVYNNALFRAFLPEGRENMLAVAYMLHSRVGDAVACYGKVFMLKRVSGDLYEESMVYNEKDKTITKELPNGNKIIHCHEQSDSFVVDDTNKVLHRRHVTSPNPYRTRYIWHKGEPFRFLTEGTIDGGNPKEIVRVFTTNDPTTIGIFHSDMPSCSCYWKILRKGTGDVYTAPYANGTCTYALENSVMVFART